MSDSSDYHDYLSVVQSVNASRHHRSPAVPPGRTGESPVGIPYALSHAGSDDVDVASDQVWMASDGRGLRAYVLVVGVCDDARMIEVVPVGNDWRLQDSTTWVVDARLSPVGVDTVVWPRFRAVIPVRVLSWCLGKLDEHIARAVVKPSKRSMTLPAGLRIGRCASRPGSFDDSRRREDVDDLVRTLIVWHDSCRDFSDMRKAQPTRTVQRGAVLRMLVSRLGVTPDEAGAIVDHPDSLDADRRRLLTRLDLEDLEGLRPRTLTLPMELLVEVEQPRWRRAAERIVGESSSRDYVREGRSAGAPVGADDPRERLAAEAFMMAARTNGFGRDAWRGVLAQASNRA